MSVLEAAIGWLAPPDCLVCGTEGSALCDECTLAHIMPFGSRCWRCNSLSTDSQTCKSCYNAGPLGRVWITTAYDGYSQQLVQLYKFGHLRAASKPISKLMAGSITAYELMKYIVVPVPTATSRVRQRGFGHSELLAKAIAYRLHLPYYPLLRRIGQTRQLGARREDRLRQLDDSFIIKSTMAVAGKKIILVDDVLTTGGTLISAAKILKKAGVNRVDAAVFAKKL